MSSIRTLSALASIALAALALATVGAAPVAAATAKPCRATARGVLWTFQGQTGVAYKVVGVGGASCPLGISWLARLTRQKGPIFKGPAGWSCAARRPSGSCTVRGGGIFHWEPRLRPR